VKEVGSCADRTLTLWNHHTVGAGDNQWAGQALAAGDFDGDGRDEIAVGRPAADVDDDGGTERQSAGAVTIAHNELGVWVFSQSLSELDAASSDGVESFDQFGTTLTVGNFNGDTPEAMDYFGSVLAAGLVDRKPLSLNASYHDLVVGTYQEDYAPGLVDDGLVQVLYGAMFADGFDSGNLTAWSSSVP